MISNSKIISSLKKSQDDNNSHMYWWSLYASGGGGMRGYLTVLYICILITAYTKRSVYVFYIYSLQPSLQVGNTTIGLQSDKTNSQQYPYTAILYFQECTRYPSVSLSKLIFFRLWFLFKSVCAFLPQNGGYQWWFLPRLRKSAKS